MGGQFGRGRARSSKIQMKMGHVGRISGCANSQETPAVADDRREGGGAKSRRVRLRLESSRGGLPPLPGATATDGRRQAWWAIRVLDEHSQGAGWMRGFDLLSPDLTQTVCFEESAGLDAVASGWSFFRAPTASKRIAPTPPGSLRAVQSQFRTYERSCPHLDPITTGQRLRLPGSPKAGRPFARDAAPAARAALPQP